jgi:hypothetical protein
MLEKVATPSRDVVVVDVIFVVAAPMVCCRTDELAAVIVICWSEPV